MSAGAKQKRDMAQYQQQVITTILHILGNLRHRDIEVLPEVELSYPQVLVLYALLEREDLTIGELARHLKFSQAVASRTVERMVEKGLVERTRDSSDRRVAHVTLSGAGREYATRMVSYHTERLESQFLEATNEERDLFLRMLKRIDSGLGEGAVEEGRGQDAGKPGAGAGMKAKGRKG